MIPDKDPYKIQLMEGFKIEWERLSPILVDKEIVSIYFGGGTPYLMGSEAIHEILSWIPKTTYPREITLEANPENVNETSMKNYFEAGINRVSIGVQTLDNPLLKSLGRLHSANRALDAVYETYAAGIDNISIDLMYDLPNQTLKSWEASLKKAIDLPISHLSLYNLTIEPHTLFFKQRNEIEKIIPDEETSLQMYEMAQEILSEKLIQYEISAFAMKDKRSYHNLGYWVGRPFLGLGPSAFSYYKNKRFQNVANLNRYHRKLLENMTPVDFIEELDPLSRRRELLTIHLRMLEGVDLTIFEKTHGDLDPETHETIGKLIEEGYLLKNQSIIQLTKKGILFYDSVASELV